MASTSGSSSRGSGSPPQMATARQAASPTISSSVSGSGSGAGPRSASHSGVVTASPRTEPDELAEFLIGEFGQRHLVSGEQAVSDRALVTQQLADVVLDRVLGDEVVHMDGLVAPDAVGKVGGLVFGGGVPVPVEVDHVVGAGEVETDAGGADGQDEALALAGLEPVHDLLAPGDRDAAVHDVGGRAPGAKVTSQEMRHGHVAGEDESRLTPFCYSGEQVVETSELARASGLGVGVPAVGALTQVVSRRVADLAERLQHPQDEAATLDAAARADVAEGVAGDGGVQGPLLGGQLDEMVADDLLWELGGDGRVGLPAPEEKGADEAVQVRRCPECLRGPEQARVGPVQDGPQISKAVLDRRAGDRDTQPRVQLAEGRGLHAARVLD